MNKAADKLSPKHDNFAFSEFMSPLQGTYDHDYKNGESSASRLYELGKSMNWNASVDVDWSSKSPACPLSATQVGLDSFPGFAALQPSHKDSFLWDYLEWHVSQFLHGEQGALLVASQLVTCAPDTAAKLFAASQTYDEARHVEVFKRYLESRGLKIQPINSSLSRLLQKLLTDERWDLKLIGMQLIIESLALAILHSLSKRCNDPLLNQIIAYVLKDESRHIQFGESFLKSHLAGLSQQERDERARFGFDACVIMRDRFTPREVFVRHELSSEAAWQHISEGDYLSEYRHLLFKQVVPVFNRVGLITPQIEPMYAELGLLEYRDAESV
jgi:hypothetical protein